MAGPGHNHGRRFADQASKAKVAKAGKRSARFTPPPAPNPDNAAARGQGEQQFQSRTAITVPGVDLLGRPIAIPVPFRWDAARKHVVFAPRKQAVK